MSDVLLWSLVLILGVGCPIIWGMGYLVWFNLIEKPRIDRQWKDAVRQGKFTITKSSQEFLP